MWPWGTPFKKTMIKTKHYCFEVFISIRFCLNKCGQLIMLGYVGQAEVQAMVWTYNLYGVAKTRDCLRVTCPSWACSRATRRSPMTESKMFLGSLLWSKLLLSLWIITFLRQWHLIHPLKSLYLIFACDKSLISPYHLMANTRRHVLGIQDKIIPKIKILNCFRDFPRLKISLKAEIPAIFTGPIEVV